MNYKEIKKLLDIIGDKKFTGGVSTESINLVEQELDTKFPCDYFEYLNNLGCGYVSSEDFFGLGGEDHLDMFHRYKLLREQSKHTLFPVDYIPLKPDGYGNYECIDIGKSSNDKALIVLWLHDGGDNQECEVLSIGFWEWFSRELEEIKEFDEIGGQAPSNE